MNTFSEISDTHISDTLNCSVHCFRANRFGTNLRFSCSYSLANLAGCLNSIYAIFCSVVKTIPTCHAEGQGSIPRWEIDSFA